MGSMEIDLQKGQSAHTELPSAPGLLQQWHSKPMPLRIIHVGAGATGLCCAFKMERQLTDYELVCYEKNPGIGGTWYENRYPGCACDVPAHNYTYTFEPNPSWSSYYAYAPEILRYFQNFHDKYNLGKYIKLSHKVISAHWREDNGQWKVQVEHNGEVFTDWCHILINGSGFLNKWKWPTIEGLHSFKGDLIHSASWDDTIDFANKKVAVLGTGSSAIQIIPQVQKVASELVCFMRSNTWISPPMPHVQVEVPKEQLDPEITNKMKETMVHIDGRVKLDSHVALSGSAKTKETTHHAEEEHQHPSSAASNGITTGRAVTNGATINGITTNGATVDGATTRGTTINGTAENGIATKEVTFDETSTDGPHTKESSTQGGAVGNTDLEGAAKTIEKVTKGVVPLEQDLTQYYYKPEEIKKLTEDPEYLLNYRKRIEFAMNTGFKIFYKGSAASELAQKYMAAEMARRLNYHPELMQRLIPDWPVGCRRLTPGDGYLESLIQPNTVPVYSEITSVDKTGLTTEDGRHFDVDVIVCATGFEQAITPHYDLRGVDDVSLKDSWSPSPKCYLGLAAPGFPNYWVMNGPRGNHCNGTVLPCFETQLEYVIKAAKKIQSDRIRAIEVKQNITDSLNRYINKWHVGGVWSGNCKSRYKGNTIDGEIICWGGSSLHYLKTIKYPRWEHYNVRYLDDNPWALLGNGRTKGEYLDDFEMMTPYMRSSDTPWDIE